MATKIFFLYLVRLIGYKTANSTQSVPWCSFFLTRYSFTLKISVPKYSQKLYGGLVEAEIFILYLVRFSGYKTR